MRYTLDAPALPSDLNPLATLLEDFGPEAGALPIDGGWGYSKAEACRILRPTPEDGSTAMGSPVGIERTFVHLRNQVEFIGRGPERMLALEWRLLRQGLIGDGERHLDHLVCEVSGIPEAAWLALRAEFEGPEGARSGRFDFEAHERKRDAARVSVEREFWFDVSAFF